MAYLKVKIKNYWRKHLKSLVLQQKKECSHAKSVEQGGHLHILDQMIHGLVHNAKLEIIVLK